MIQKGTETLKSEYKKLNQEKEKFEAMTKKLENFHVNDKVVLDIGRNS